MNYILEHEDISNYLLDSKYVDFESCFIVPKITWWGDVYEFR